MVRFSHPKGAAAHPGACQIPFLSSAAHCARPAHAHAPRLLTDIRPALAAKTLAPGRGVTQGATGPHRDANAMALPCGQCSTHRSCPVARLATPLAQPLPVAECGFRAGETLQEQGLTSRTIRIVKSGATMLCRASRYGDRQPIGVLGRGTVLGSFGLLGRAHPHTHVAILEGRYCEVDTTVLQALGLLDDRLFLAHVAQAVALSVESQADWCQLRHVEGVTRQLAGALLHFSELQCSLRVRLPSQSTLAALLNTTRESITRGFARLEKEGDISRSGRYYCDLHVPGLMRHIHPPPDSVSPD